MDGPYRDRPSFDFIAQAMSGFMSVNGAEGEPPARAAPPLSDLIAGAYAAMGICAALVRRERTGKGEEVATASTDSMIANLAFLATHYFETGEQPLRTGNDHALVAPYGLFEAADGQVAIAPSNDQVYFKLLDVLGPRAPAHASRVPAPIATVSSAARRSTRSSTRRSASSRSRTGSTVLNAAGVPCGRVMSLKEVFDDPQIRHQQMQDHDRPSAARAARRARVSRSSSPTIPAASIACRRTSAPIPTRSWPSSATVRDAIAALHATRVA